VSAAGVVIIGAGQAGSEVATSLRQQGFADPISLIGDEPYLPYRRPPLSKAFLAGDVALESLFIKSQATYDKLKINCRTGIGVESIDRAERQLRLYDGTLVAYDRLVLATGGRARHLSLQGAEFANVHYIRSVEDILRLRAGFTSGARLVIIGGGYIGLEAASVGVKKGLLVTVVEALPRVLARVAVPELSAFYERLHRNHGVDVRTGVGVHGFEGHSRVETVVLADGQRLAVDLVVVGVGLIPNTELAEAAGLEVQNGVVVDAAGCTSDPSIYGAGDCTFHENTFYGRRHRLESVPNALEQARVVASNLCGKAAAYAAVPWFWSDQYDLKLQMVGLSEGHDRLVIRGKLDDAHFIAFHLKEGIVISAQAVNRAQDFIIAKRLVAERVSVVAERLADEAAPLKDLIAAAGLA